MNKRQYIVVPGKALTAVVRDCFLALGLPADDARAIADAVVDANLRGIDSHGLQRVPTYLRRVHDGLAQGSDRMTTTSEFGPLCRLDAGHALGPAGATKAADTAVDLARRYGLALVALGRSGHFGAAGFYARRIAREGLIGIVMSNGPATMAPHGASTPFLGTSALAIATPLGRHGEFALDMAASVVARGKIMRAAAHGTSIAPGLAIDSNGEATTDPRAALAGSVLPIGGPKGSGLAFAINILAAVLGGADFDDEMAPLHGDPAQPQNVGHIFLVIDPWRVADPQSEIDRLERLIDRLHALGTANGSGRVVFAGEASELLARERRKSGIPIDRDEIEAAAQACTDCGIPQLADRLRRLLRDTVEAPSILAKT